VIDGAYLLSVNEGGDSITAQVFGQDTTISFDRAS